MKKKYLIFIMLLCISFLFLGMGAGKTEDEVLEDVSTEVDNQLGDLDFSDLEDLLAGLDEEQLKIFGDSSFVDKIKMIINGEFKELGNTVISATINLVLKQILDFLPLVATILAIGILSSMLGNLRSGKDKSLGDVIHFVCYALVLVLISSAVMQMLNLSRSTLETMKAEIDILFPILLTLMTAIGGTVSVSVYQPAIALLSGSIMQIFNLVLVPIFIFSLVFAVISNLTSTVKLEKFNSFLNSCFKWLVGSMFTIFIAFMSIQGITAGSYDGISVKTAKFALKSYVPILGGYLADGFNVIVASSVLIKNAIGACGLLLIFVSVLSPILTIVIFSLLLKLTASILEPLSDGRISSFLFSVSKSLTMLLVILIGVAFMFLIITALIMCSANFI